jgi:predicted nucleic acid-binding protein
MTALPLFMIRLGRIRTTQTPPASVISELRKPSRDPGVERWLTRVAPSSLYLCTLTIGELEHGVVRLELANDARAPKLRAWVDGLQRIYRRRILRITRKVARRWGDIVAREPMQLEHMVDTYLAATSLVYGMTLVTRNVQDVTATGCLVHNPFTGTGTLGDRSA